MEIRDAYLKTGRQRRRISLGRLRSATRRGVLLVRLSGRARRRHHATRGHAAHRASLSGSTLVVITAETTTPQTSSSTTSATSIFTPVADAYVISNRKKSNYGTAVELRASSSPTARSYVRFNVQGLAEPVSRATLRLYATAGSSVGFDLRSVSDSSWGEQTVVYANAPAIGNVVGSSAAFPSASWVSIDVTTLVSGNGALSLAVTPPGSSSTTLASRETGGNSPQLVVETTAPSPDPAPSPAPDPTPVPLPSPDLQPSLPMRAAFYYPWFPETWMKNGSLFTQYSPTLGLYDSSSTAVIQQHVGAMQYGGIEAGISSWWGPGHRTDTRFGTILSATNTIGSPFRWSLYYENESLGDPNVTTLASELAYIRDHYASNPAYLRVSGRFVVFVYADATDACGMADRWKQANTGINAYVVLKVFSGYRFCSSQPDGWHQYSPAVAADSQGGYSYAISPGFHLGDEALPRLSRDLSRWNQNVRDMTASNAPFQLVTTFNEWGEGTAVESASQWASSSGYGAYLDALHNNGQTSTPPPSPPAPPPNQPPSASLAVSPNPALVGQSVTFDASASSDADGSITNYKWDLDGNGSFETDTGSSQTASRSYASAGDVAVKLRVTDDAGATADATRTLTVNAPDPPPSTDPVIAAAGDIACDPGSSAYNSGLGTSSECRQKPTSDLLVGAGLAGVLTLGDNQYDDGTLAKFQLAFHPTWGRVKSIIHPGIGNHEYQTSGAVGYFDYFNGVANSNGPAGERGKAYYSFDVGAWHLIALNSNCSIVSCAAGSVQEQWLRADLAAHSNSCVLAYWHHPRFSSGTHGNNPATQPLWQALYDANADVVLNGHDHGYERFGRQDAGGALDSTRGVREFVVGTGGRNHYSFTGAQPNSEIRNSDTFGMLRLALHANGYDWRFVPESGKTFSDSGSESCH
jgi:YD repeat-containing protein